MVYGAFALCFDVLMIPFWMCSTLLGRRVRAGASKIVETYLIVGRAWCSGTFSPGREGGLVDL